MPDLRNFATRPVLVAGAPRSGTTWIGTVLSLAEGACSVHEPDNASHDPYAVRASIGLGRFPILNKGDEAPAEYEELWRRALAGLGHRRTPQWAAAKMVLRHTPRAEFRAAFDEGEPAVSPRLAAVRRLASPRSLPAGGPQAVVKSVHGTLALPWLAERFSPKMVIVLRHPLNVVASYLELGWADAGLHTRMDELTGRFGITVPELPAGASLVSRVAWQTGLFASVFTALGDRHPGWRIVTHEELCRNPHDGFRRLFAGLGLTWTQAASDFLDQSNRPGTGIRTNRVTRDQPGRWRHRLTYSQVEEVRRILGLFPALFEAEELIA
ncbi:MAG TPA: sulfotransferase [Acidimicrobiia bacterium]|nr:sulfotransferase [Acidimicrobiia bacterium]